MSIDLIDRALQKRLLEFFAKTYPDARNPADLSEIDARARTVNLAYLSEHGLVEHRQARFSSGPAISVGWALTADGADFLLADGGLSAILGVVTIRLHDDTIKALIETRIMRSDLGSADKQKFLTRLRSLPADATKHLVMGLLDRGMDQGLEWLQTYLS